MTIRRTWHGADRRVYSNQVIWHADDHVRAEIKDILKSVIYIRKSRRRVNERAINKEAARVNQTEVSLHKSH